MRGDGPPPPRDGGASESGDGALPGAVAEVAPRVIRADASSSSTSSASWTWERASRTRWPSTRPATRCGCSGSATGRSGCCRSVEGLTLVDLPGADECCGFGGTFAVKNADTSVAMGDDKVDALVATGAEVLTVGRHVVPDAPRRPAVAARLADPGHAPRRDPRRGRGRMTDFREFRARRDRRHDAAPSSPARRRSRGREGRPRRRPAPGEPRPRDDDDPREAGPGRRRASRTGSSSALAGAAIKDEVLARLPELLDAARAERDRRRWRGPLGPRRGRGQRDRRPAREGRRRRRGRQGQVDGDPGDRAQRGARAGRASPPGRPTSRS